MMKSLQGRLTTGMLAGLITVFLIQWVLVSLAIKKVTENYVASRLEHEIESLLVALSFDSRGKAILDSRRLNPIYQRPFSGHYFRIATAKGVVRSRSLWDEDLSVPLQKPGHTLRTHIIGPRKQTLLVLVHGYRKQGIVLSVAVAEDMTPIMADITRFQAGYAILTAAILLVLVIVQRITVRQALRPLDRTRENLAKLEQGKVQELSETVPREIKPLVHEINRLIHLTVQRLTRSRNAVGNLAHALKTPLTVLSQIAGDKDLEPQAALQRSIAGQTDIMRRLIERELKRARLAGEGPSGARFAIDAEVPTLVDALRHIYSEKNLDIETRLPLDHSFAGDREDILELLGNLLDNACKWARRKVRLTVEAAPGLSFAVEDDGAGVSEQQRETLACRGIRLDEATEGYGLGLSIVRDIVDQYDGTLDCGRSENLGGFRVCVRLPAKDLP